MANVTVSTDIDTMMQAADNAAIRAAILAAGTGSNNALTGVNNLTKIPSLTWVDIAGGTALTNGIPYFGAASGTKTYTFTDLTPNGTTSANFWHLRLTVSGGTQTINFPSSIRVGSLVVTPITSLAVPVGDYDFHWSFANSAIYLTDSVPGTTAIPNGGTGATTASTAFDALSGAETTVASATTTDLGAVTSNKVSISGTTTITGFGTVAAGVQKWGRFTGALTLTYNATSLILPGAANITTVAGDSFMAVSLGSGNWVVENYSPISGRSAFPQGAAYPFAISSTFNPANATKYFFGFAGAASTNAGRNVVYIHRSGTVIGGSITVRRTGTDSTAWTLGFAISGGAQNDIATVSTAATDFSFNNFAMNVAVTGGQYIEISTTCPTWGTPPTGVTFSGTLFVV